MSSSDSWTCGLVLRSLRPRLDLAQTAQTAGEQITQKRDRNEEEGSIMLSNHGLLSDAIFSQVVTHLHVIDMIFLYNLSPILV